MTCVGRDDHQAEPRRDATGGRPARAAGGVAATSARGRDRGYTLVESVVTVVLLGIIVVPIFASVRASVKASSISHSAAEVETALVNAADRINRAPLSCDYTDYVEAAVESQGWTADRASVALAWKDGASWVDEGTTGDGCESPGPTMDLVQRVTIRITSPNGDITRALEVVKSHV